MKQRLGLVLVLFVSALAPLLASPELTRSRTPKFNGENLNLIAANKLAANKLGVNGTSFTSAYGSDQTPIVQVRAVTLAEGTPTRGDAVNRALLAAALTGTLLWPAGGARSGSASVTLVGSELVVVDQTGPLPATVLTGAVLELDLEAGGHAEVRIDRMLVDPRVPERDVLLYDLSVADDADGWQPVCAPDPDGARHAVLQPGQHGRIAIYCTAGALGKCIHFGYRPWAKRDGVPLAPYRQACVRMVRANYCGDGQPTTRDGMLIDIYDDLGIQQRTDAPGLSFEAAWDEHGAICMAHPRVPQNITLAALAAACPRLSGRLGPDCTAAAAHRLGTPLILEDSRGDGIPEGSD